MKRQRLGLGVVGFALVVLLAALVPAACGTATFIVQQYKGEPLPSHLVAVLRFSGGDAARVVSLDGEVLQHTQLDPGERVHIELLPGEHEVGVANPASPILIVEKARFRAEQGKFYRARVMEDAGRPEVAGGTHWSLAVFEIDRDSDEWMRDVSLAAKKEAPLLEPPKPPTPTVAPAPPPEAPPNQGSGGAGSVSPIGAAGQAAAGSGFGGTGAAGSGSTAPAP